MTGTSTSRRPETVYLGLGSNAGDRPANLREAVRRLAAKKGISVRALSSVYETEAHVHPGQSPQPDHLNAAVAVETSLTPTRLLATLKGLEKDAGREEAAEAWSLRPLDIDILVFGDRILSKPELEIPHPRIAERRFVLAPLCDIAPDLVLPGSGTSIRELLDVSADPARVIPTGLILAP